MFELDDVPWMVPLIAGLTEIVKQFKVPSKWVPVAAVGIGVGLALLYEVTVQFPWLAPWIVGAIRGAIGGLTTVGLYLISKKFRPAGPETPEVFAPPRRR